jgi:hypothetical protein
MPNNSSPRPPVPVRGKRPDEQFDMNSATLAGVVQKLWGHNGDVFARLRVSRRSQLVEMEDARSSLINLRFTNGMVGDQDLSMQPGDVVRVTSYLSHSEFDETIRNFLEAARKPDFLDNVPREDLPAWQAIAFKRVNTMFNVETLELLDSQKQEGGVINRVVLEGPIARQWTHSEDIYLRLAVYDSHTRVTKEKGNYGRPRRLPHYLTILLPGGKTTGGRQVVANVKDRLRVTGELQDHGYRRTLHEMLLATGSSAVMELLQRLPNAGDLHTISAQQESLHVVASVVNLAVQGSIPVAIYFNCCAS